MRDFLAEIIRNLIRWLGYLAGLERVIRFLRPSPVYKIIPYSRSRLQIDSRYHSDWKLYYHGFYPPAVSRFILGELPKFLGTNPVMFDIGAGHGNLAILLAEVCGPGGKVVAVECFKKAHEIARKQIILNNYAGKVILVDAALTDKDGEVEFILPTDGFGNVLNSRRALSSEAGQGVPIQSIRFRTLLGKLGIEKLDFIRLDVQGFEMDFFADNWALLQRERPVLSFMADADLYKRVGHSLAEAYQFLRSLGYRIYRYQLFLGKYRGRLKEVSEVSLGNPSRRFPDNWVAIKK